MPRAYERRERWLAIEAYVEQRMDGGEVICRAHGDDPAHEDAIARLIAESPERDELLHAIEEWLTDALRVELHRLDEAKALLARIRATLARTEG